MHRHYARYGQIIYVENITKCNVHVWGAMHKHLNMENSLCFRKAKLIRKMWRRLLSLESIMIKKMWTKLYPDQIKTQ